MDRLTEFLNLFYETMSFDSVELFDSMKFEGLFSQSATLVELADDTLGSETILEYINRFLYEIKHYPERYSHGLRERQTAYECVADDDFVFVQSDYEKAYFDGEQTVTSTGRHYITLCRDGDWFKILFIAWKA